MKNMSSREKTSKRKTKKLTQKKYFLIFSQKKKNLLYFWTDVEQALNTNTFTIIS